MSAFTFSGINLAITTPFDAQGKIDYPRFESLLERYISAGVHGFVLSSGTGMHVYPVSYTHLTLPTILLV